MSIRSTHVAFQPSGKILPWRCDIVARQLRRVVNPANQNTGWRCIVSGKRPKTIQRLGVSGGRGGGQLDFNRPVLSFHSDNHVDLQSSFGPPVENGRPLPLVGKCLACLYRQPNDKRHGGGIAEAGGAIAGQGHREVGGDHVPDSGVRFAQAVGRARQDVGHHTVFYYPLLREQNHVCPC